MKCIKCGKMTDVLIENICHSCYSQTSLVKEFKALKFRYCYGCGQLYYRNRKVSDLTTILTKYTVPNEHVIIDDLSYTLNIKDKLVNLDILGHFDFEEDKHIEEKFELSFELGEFFCERCRQKSSQGFAAIIQLRNKNNVNYEKIKDEIYPILNQEANIVKFEQLPEGDDFYVAKIDKGYSIARKTVKKYGGQINISKKIFTQDKFTSKQVFRVSIHLRLYDFSLKDIIFINNSLYSVNKIDKNKVVMKNLYDDNSIIKEFSDITKIVKPSDIKKTQIISIKPQPEVLNDDYENIVLITNKKHKIDDSVKVFIDKNVAFEIL